MTARSSSGAPPQRKLSSNLMQMAFMNRNNNTNSSSSNVVTADAIVKRARPNVSAAAAAATAAPVNVNTNATNTNAIASTVASTTDDAATLPAGDEDEWVVADLVHFSHVRPKRSIQVHSNLLSPLADGDGVGAGRRSLGAPPPPTQNSSSTNIATSSLSSKKRPLSSVSGGVLPRPEVADDSSNSQDASSSSSDSVHTVNVRSSALPSSFGKRAERTSGGVSGKSPMRGRRGGKRS